MVAVIDLKAEFARLKMLKGRTRQRPRPSARGLRPVGTLSRRRAFIAKFAGTSAWERHPQGDEIVQIVLVVRSFPDREPGQGTTSDLPSAV